MKTTRKLLACLLVVVMLASMFCVGASAAPVDIEINGPEGVTYTVYKVFDIAERNGTAVLYEWTAGTTDVQKAALTSHVTETKGYVSLSNDSTAGALALATAVINSGKYSAFDTVTISSSEKTVQLDDGYYVMKDDATAAISAFSIIGGQIIAGGNTITPKADLPAITKTVTDTDGIVSADAPLYYTLVITADNSAFNYAVVDTPVGVGNIRDVAITATKTITPDDYTITIPAEKNKLTVTFDADYLEKLVANDTITITYTANLVDGFTTGTTANTNTAVLTYGTGTLYKDATEKVYTGEIKFNKTDDSGNPLSGATFVIKKGSQYATIVNGTLTGWVDDEVSATPITTTGSTITIKGFDLGTYTLVETDAPAGYIYADPVDVIIQADSTEGVANPGTKDIKNVKGDPLPETGGIGTTVFYAVGGCLVLAALVILLTKKRTTAE